MQSIVIGIAGTAKNTGKTTTTRAIMEQVIKDKNIVLGLTSIGYDGEDIDNITGLPKPKIEVWPGVVIAVAEKCLKVSTAKIEILEATNILTPLGKIILGKVVGAGRLLVAGPNKSKELRQILFLLRRYSANFIIVDGALNRIAPMVEVDGLIIATGAARTPDIKKLAQETRNIVEILQLPVVTVANDSAYMDCVLDSETVKKLVETFDKHKSIDINGIISTKSFEDLLAAGDKINGKRLIFSDAIKLLVCGEINNIYNLFTKLKDKNLEISVKKSIDVIAITINPYYPQFRFSSDDYTEAYVDKDELNKAIKGNVRVPVYDVVKEGGEKLYIDILNYWNKVNKLTAK
ncbi:MAG: hypothetical protein PWQ67_2744 [Clostridia bacterium]|jgi:ribosomal protein L39E|nr:hypothetical protein [Clostridia bacterium]